MEHSSIFSYSPDLSLRECQTLDLPFLLVQLSDGWACGVATIEGLYGEVDFTVLLEQIVYYQFIGILTDLFSV